MCSSCTSYNTIINACTIHFTNSLLCRSTFGSVLKLYLISNNQYHIIHKVYNTILVLTFEWRCTFKYTWIRVLKITRIEIRILLVYVKQGPLV